MIIYQIARKPPGFSRGECQICNPYILGTNTTSSSVDVFENTEWYKYFADKVDESRSDAI